MQLQYLEIYFSFGPVAPKAAEYYGVNGNMIDLFHIVGMAINIPGMFIAIYCIDRFGIKVRVQPKQSLYHAQQGRVEVRVQLSHARAAIRCLSTFPAYEEKIAKSTKFWLTFLGQAIIALGHPFLITLSTKVSLLPAQL